MENSDKCQAALLQAETGRCPGHSWHEEEPKEPVVPKGMVTDIVDAVMWELKASCGLLREEVEVYLDAAIQNSDATAIQNSMPG